MKNYTFVDYSTQAYSAVVAILILLFHNGTVVGWPWLLAAHAAGFFLIHGLIQLHANHRDNKPLNFLRHFYPVLLYTAFFCETGHLNRMFFADFLDPVAVRWDMALFHCEPGAVLMRNLPSFWLSEFLYVAYFSYYLMIVGVGLALFLRNQQQFSHYIAVISFVFYVCYLIFIVFPVIGPQVMTGDAPGYTLPGDLQYLVISDAYPDAFRSGKVYQLMAWIYRVFEAPGSAFPSSHVAVALSTGYFCFRYLPAIRIPYLVAVILLCVATMYCHYHYGVDVLGGIVTAAVLTPLGEWLYRKVDQQEILPWLNLRKPFPGK